MSGDLAEPPKSERPALSNPSANGKISAAGTRSGHTSNTLGGQTGAATMNDENQKRAYWRKNLQYLAILLSVWFAASFLCSAVFVDQLDKIQIGGYRIGFYIAQQGAIWIFVEIIFIYAWLMNRLERQFQPDEPTQEEAAP